METTFYSLATKTNFNKALNHFYRVNDVVDEIESGRNFADAVNVMLAEGDLTVDQVLPMIGAIIKDKYQYSYDSYNVPVTINDFSKIVEETSKWTALDIILVYFTVNSEPFLINPKNMIHWERVRDIVRDQLMVIYVKKKKEPNPKVENDAINAIEEMMAGKDVFINKEFIDETVAVREAKKQIAPAEAAAAGKKNMTPKYAVTVTNELFHNGNVEAWKRIIESFKVSHPDLDVLIFHEGEKINDINSLFKWGKVKHGDPILFQVVGENIRNVSKLQKYLFEGASPRFEQFLKIAVGKVLNLF
ncbi:MAG TPA: hypothetical protein PLH80_06960 [Spirochaetota bacterium]|nr:hypothetical protein [Spirochaetota bacterium]HOR92884.1 hypothetical protein [Spirochaetota bacterium]HOT19186.1 hypothetical protein [Spirochaetota bacterium]HPD04649.1 hypothetical protein [Spirochaetota bacterium]HPK43658.1 hypothetical protein [Spirochaetota bacterium]